MGFVVDKIRGKVFSEYFGFPCQFHRLLQPHRLSSRAGTIGQLVADVPSGLSVTPPQESLTGKRKDMGRNKDTKRRERRKIRDRGSRDIRHICMYVFMYV
jgi:hypothetical protein